MSLLVPQSFQINNCISISTKIKNISFFYIYFNPIQTYKNLDNNYKILPTSSSNIIQSKIKYKLTDFIFPDLKAFIFEDNFSKSLYHLLIASSILNNNSICYIISTNPFIYSNNVPILNDFSFSLDLNKISYKNLKSYFPSYLLKNPYIPIDIFLISFLIQNNISVLDNENVNIIMDNYIKDREKIEVYFILTLLQYFLNYSTEQIIKYLMQFKYTWSYFSLIYYFIVNYPELLKEHLLYDTCLSYIQCQPKERNKNIIKTINNILFEI